MKVEIAAYAVMGCYSSNGRLSLELDMSAEQMRDALASFAEHATAEQWAEWQARIEATA